VREARDRGTLASVRSFVRMTATGVVWPDGSETRADAITGCTSFRAALGYLDDLGVVGDDGRVAVRSIGQANAEPALWLRNFGDQPALPRPPDRQRTLAREIVRAIAPGEYA
jgi:putative flavoprotein involved in K+ transport